MQPRPIGGVARPSPCNGRAGVGSWDLGTVAAGRNVAPDHDYNAEEPKQLSPLRIPWFRLDVGESAARSPCGTSTVPGPAVAAPPCTATCTTSSIRTTAARLPSVIAYFCANSTTMSVFTGGTGASSSTLTEPPKPAALTGRSSEVTARRHCEPDDIKLRDFPALGRRWSVHSRRGIWSGLRGFVGSEAPRLALRRPRCRGRAGRVPRRRRGGDDGRPAGAVHALGRPAVSGCPHR